MYTSTRVRSSLIASLMLISNLCATLCFVTPLTGAGSYASAIARSVVQSSLCADDSPLDELKEQTMQLILFATSTLDHRYSTLLAATMDENSAEVAARWEADDRSVLFTDNWTFLHWAVIMENLALVAFFLAKRVPVNTQTDRRKATALDLAAKDGLTEIVLMLLNHGADKKLHNSDGKTAAMVARETGHEEIAALIEGYSDPE